MGIADPGVEVIHMDNPSVIPEEVRRVSGNVCQDVLWLQVMRV
jgi:hypothetical protein